MVAILKEQRVIVRSARLLVLLALSLAPILCDPLTAQTADGQSYEVEIAGRRFDPKSVQRVVPDDLRLTPHELAKQKKEASYYLVQLYRSPDLETRAQLKSKLGVTFDQYVPKLSYIEKLAPGAAAAAAKDLRVRAIIPFEPAFKLSPTIGKFVARTPQRKAVQGLLLTAFLFPDADAEAASRSIAALGATDVKLLDDRRLKGGKARIRFTLPSADRLALIARLDGIRWIEEVGEIILDNSLTAATLQSGNRATPSLWNRGLQGEGQIIGIIDGGKLDIDHCFFKDPSDNVPGPKHRKVVDLRNASRSEAGEHATFTAGNAAGDDFNAPGTHVHRGGAWKSRLAVGNVYDIWSTSTLHAELTAAADKGAFIHTNSWHSTPTDSITGAIAVDVDTFVWNNPDHLVLGSVGNENEEQGPPATAKNVLGVGASKAYPDVMEFGDGNPGPTADGRRKPDLMAPGCGVQSSLVGTSCNTGPRRCGTSYATPHAAAAAALVRQYFIEGWYVWGTRAPHMGTTPSSALLRAMLINSATDMTGEPGYPSDKEGWGLVRLENALYFSGGIRNLKVVDRRTGLSRTGETHHYQLKLADSRRPLKVVLVWTEPPPTVGTGGHLVNNLDRSVVSPDGTRTFLGNVFGTSGSSVTGGVADSVNNVEVVLVDKPPAGRWTINVIGRDVNFGTPPYALVVTGHGVSSADEGNLTPPLVSSFVGCPFGLEYAGSAPNSGGEGPNGIVPLYRCRRSPDTDLVGAYERLNAPIGLDICSRMECCRPGLAGLACPALDLRVVGRGSFDAALLDEKGAVLAKPSVEKDGLRLRFQPKSNQPTFLSIVPRVDSAKGETVDVQVFHTKAKKR